MESALARMWWAVTLRGALAIVFGILAFLWPELFWFAVVIMFAAYALADGVLSLIAAVRGDRAAGPRWALALGGVVSIAAGGLAIAWPEITEFVLLCVIAGWAIATGVLSIAAAIRLRREIRGEWVLALAGVLSIVLGVGLVLLPGPGLVAIAWWVGANAIVFGALLLALGFRLRGLPREPAASRDGTTWGTHPRIAH